MNYEIERKFLIKELPVLSNYKMLKYERYFLFNSNGIEIRIQKKGDKYELERKENESTLSTKKQKFKITEQEFHELKKGSTESIKRKSYKISDTPNITIKIYESNYNALRRVEVEFQDEQEAINFKPLLWFGPEITGSVL